MKKFFLSIGLLLFYLSLCGQISGTGTTNVIPIFTSPSSIGNSGIFQGFFLGRSTIGIGTAPTAYKLYVRDDYANVSTLVLDNPSSGGGFQVVKGSTQIGFMGAADTWTSATVPTNDFGIGSYSSAIRFFTANSPSLKMILNSVGNLGIGTSNPLSKLSVNGKIEAEEIQIKTDVPDYVFAKEYKLMTIEELEEYINTHKVLPNIQTQKDVEDNRGLVRLGALTVSLMEKVEELTLHLIDLNKRLKELESNNKRGKKMK